MRLATSAALAVLGLAAGCVRDVRSGAGTVGLQVGEVAETDLAPAERDRRSCKIAFALCAPPANFDPETDVEELPVKSLVQITWRLDLSDALCAKAGEHLRKLAEHGDVATVREIADAGESAAATLGHCRCEGDKFRPQYELQRIAEIVAGRLPPPELRKPEYWADRIDPHLAKLRSLSRRSAELLAGGDDAGLRSLEAEARDEERSLCEDVQAARDVLSERAMAEMRALLYKARERASGEASVEAARRVLERAERQPSCAAAEPPPAE